MPLEVRSVRCLESNYGLLARDQASGEVAAIDAPDAEVLLAEAERLGWGRIGLVLNTHWHGDHTQGNAALQAATGARIVGPEEVRRVAPLDEVAQPDDEVAIGATRLSAIETGGHTLGHLSWHAPEAGLVFTGDALFPLGCGRMFEGTAEQFWAGLERLAALPPQTVVWAAHEYGVGNARFALSVETDPQVRATLEARLRDWESGLSSMPTTIGDEAAANPFLRAAALRPGLQPAEAFGELRAMKDDFKG